MDLSVTYFEKAGRINTESTLTIAKKYARSLT